MAIPVSLTVELDHTQHCCHDEEQQYGVQQDVLGDGDAASVCWKNQNENKCILELQKKCIQLSKVNVIFHSPEFNSVLISSGF